MKIVISNFLVMYCFIMFICVTFLTNVMSMQQSVSYDMTNIPPMATSLIKNDRENREKIQEEKLASAIKNIVLTKKNKKKRIKQRLIKKEIKKPNVSSRALLANNAQKQTALMHEIADVVYRQYQDSELVNAIVSLHIKNMSIQDALALISKTSGIQLVVDADITGMIQEMRLNKMPLSVALHSLLSSNDQRLALIKESGVWRISKMQNIQEIFSCMAAQEIQKDFIAAIIPIQYAQWNDTFKQRIEKIWHGVTGNNHDKQAIYMVLDDVNKTVFAKARTKEINEFKYILQSLDIKIPQIRIDARVVIADKNFEEILGFNWSGMYDRSASIKHFDFAGIGVNSPGPNGPADLPLFKNLIGWSLNFLPNLPSITTHIPFVFGNKGMNSKRLNLELNAAENRNEIKTILKPSLLVHNDEPAEILVGEELPHQVRLDETIEGKLTNVTSVNYKDIGMKIKVKPTVLNNFDSIFLDVYVENSVVANPDLNSSTGSGVGTTGSNGSMFNYTIRTARSKNRVILKSGQTTLIGGLITESKTKEKRGVPFLKDIPILGLLFQGSRKRIVDKQILIFITPTLVDF